MSRPFSRPAGSVLRHALVWLLAASSAALAGPPPAAGADVPVGSRLVFVAYGDTRPNLYPFGSQAKHMAVTKAIQQFDHAIGEELDLVLVTGDLIFADVPFTDRDWKPAWEALANLRGGSHPLYVYPALGNHELLTLSDHTGDENDDKMIRALWSWGGSSSVHEAEAPLDAALLAQITHLAELYPELAKHLPQSVTQDYLRILWIQLSYDASGRLPESERQTLEQARHEARTTLLSAAVSGLDARAVAAKLAAASPRVVLEELAAVHEATRESNPKVVRLSHDVLARLGDPSTPEFGQLHQALGPVLAHVKALQALSHQTSGEVHERTWLNEVRASPEKARLKSWVVLHNNLMDHLGPYLSETTTLAGLSASLDASFVGPSWYYTDRQIPGGGGKTVRFIACNSNLATLVSNGSTPPLLDQETFVADAIKSHDGPVVVYEHHSPVSIGGHGGSLNPMTDLISAFREMLYKRVFQRLTPEERKRVWVSIAGHDHDYERIVDTTRGTAFIVSGGGGVPVHTKRLPDAQLAEYLQKLAPIMDCTLDPSTVYAKAYNFVACEVTPGRMEFRVFGLCEGPHTMDDPEFAQKLPGVIAGQLASDAKLIDHFVIREDASGKRIVETLPAGGCR